MFGTHFSTIDLFPIKSRKDGFFYWKFNVENDLKYFDCQNTQ